MFFTQVFHLTEPRINLITIVADKTWQDMSERNVSVFERIYERNLVIIDENLPEGLVWDDVHGEFRVFLHSEESERALEFLAAIRLFHHRVAPGANEIINQEIEIFCNRLMAKTATYEGSD